MDDMYEEVDINALIAIRLTGMFWAGFSEREASLHWVSLIMNQERDNGDS